MVIIDQIEFDGDIDAPLKKIIIDTKISIDISVLKYFVSYIKIIINISMNNLD